MWCYHTKLCTRSAGDCANCAELLWHTNHRPYAPSCAHTAARHRCSDVRFVLPDRLASSSPVYSLYSTEASSSPGSSLYSTRCEDFYKCNEPMEPAISLELYFLATHVSSAKDSLVSDEMSLHPSPPTPMRQTACGARPELEFFPGRSADRGSMMSSRGRSPLNLSSQPIQITTALHDDERCASKSPVEIAALATSSTPALVRRSRPSRIQVFAGRSQRKRTSRSPVRMSSSPQIRQVPRASF